MFTLTCCYGGLVCWAVAHAAVPTQRRPCVCCCCGSRTLCSRLCSRTQLAAIALRNAATPAPGGTRRGMWGRRSRRAAAPVQALASVTAPVLLVDGYNIIFASRRLARLASLRGLDAARERLVNEVRTVQWSQNQNMTKSELSGAGNVAGRAGAAYGRSPGAWAAGVRRGSQRSAQCCDLCQHGLGRWSTASTAPYVTRDVASMSDSFTLRSTHRRGAPGGRLRRGPDGSRGGCVRRNGQP